MWEETFEAYLGTLLQNPSNQPFTREKTERITNVLMNGKTDSARNREYVKEKKVTLINCPVFGRENELYIPVNEVRILSFQFVLHKLLFYQLIAPFTFFSPILPISKLLLSHLFLFYELETKKI